MIKFSSKPFILPGNQLLEQALNLFRVAVETFVRDVNRCPLITGNHLTDQTVSTSWGYYYHKLGRVPQGWIVTSISQRYIIAEGERTDKYLKLRCSTGTATFSMWVF